jgi:hypothetical protein
LYAWPVSLDLCTSDQQLAPRISLLFSICGHIRPKGTLLYSYYTRTNRSDGSRALSFESTSFLPIYHISDGHAHGRERKSGMGVTFLLSHCRKGVGWCVNRREIVGLVGIAELD